MSSMPTTPSNVNVKERGERRSNVSQKLTSPAGPLFKCPLGNSRSPHLEPSSLVELTDDVNILRGKLRTAESEITQLMQEGYQEVELKAHMEKLHQYNELKDTGQMLLGRIATIEGVRTKDMYEKYDLKLDD